MKRLAFVHSSPEAFLAGMPMLFQGIGYRLVGCERAADGQLLWLRNGQVLHVAYCLPTLLAVSSVEVDVCAQAMDRVGAEFGYMVTRSWFFPGAVAKARVLGIELVDGAKLRELLHQQRSSESVIECRMLVSTPMEMKLGN